MLLASDRSVQTTPSAFSFQFAIPCTSRGRVCARFSVDNLSDWVLPALRQCVIVGSSGGEIQQLNVFRARWSISAEARYPHSAISLQTGLLVSFGK